MIKALSLHISKLKNNTVMAKVNKVKIEITKLNYQRNAKTFCNTVLMLRTAYKVGDVEMVNHYVLGCLKRAKGENFDFRIIE